MLQFRTAAVSELGPVRTNNEDSAYAGPALVMVADGVGGSAAGEIASATAAFVTSAMALARPGDDPLDVLDDAIEESRRHLEHGVDLDASRAGMATTLTAVLTDGVRCAVGHLGDSRAYLLRGGRLRTLTRDHTWVQAMVDEKRMDPEQARRSPLRNMVVRWLDAAGESVPDLVRLTLRPGDRLLVCSDGLSDVLDASVLEGLVRGESRDEAPEVVDRLVMAALRAHARDNVTCVVADVLDGPPVSPVGGLHGAAWNFMNVVDAARLPVTRTG